MQPIFYILSSRDTICFDLQIAHNCPVESFQCVTGQLILVDKKRKPAQSSVFFQLNPAREPLAVIKNFDRRTHIYHISEME